MTVLPMGSGVKVWLATGHADMRCGFPSLDLNPSNWTSFGYNS
jgi:transposase